MARKKKYYYVLVITELGPIFVTDVHYADKTAEWKWCKVPKSFDKSTAEDLALGLMLNFQVAYTVSSNYEITTQPYNYAKWEIEWKDRKPVEAE